ncbi:MAG TPA: RidA family protein [Solirubrobacteraceae bacterium]|nr:RidA family protein [Solirubrobacteraceae bacterium]
MERTAVNPWPWSAKYDYNQGELLEGVQRVLEVAGQASTDDEGTPVHAGDMRAQVTCVADNIEAVLAEAQMSFADVVRVVIYTTDIDTFFQHYDVLTARFQAANVKPASTLIGVSRLAFPEMLVEIQATAMQ